MTEHNTFKIKNSFIVQKIKNRQNKKASVIETLSYRYKKIFKITLIITHSNRKQLVYEKTLIFFAVPL